MQKVDYSIEYAHIYANQTFGEEQLHSLRTMKQKEAELSKEGYTVQRHVLVDDYSTSYGLNRFNLKDFEEELGNNDAQPDLVFLESQLAVVCGLIAEKITNKSIRKSITHYYKTRKIWPCSMCVAAWYLLRLGCLGDTGKVPVSNKLISILPDRFMSPELEAKEIIAATEYKNRLDDIEVIFFESEFSNFSDWSKFDAQEYVSRNYLRQILPEDKTIIEFVADYLKGNYSIGEFRYIADIGAGPNLYPTLIAAPYCSAEASIDLIDPVKDNRDFLVKNISDLRPWDAFGSLLSQIDKTIYSGPPYLPDSVKVLDGDIFSLAKAKYDLVMSFFVAESITSDPQAVGRAMESLKSAVKPGGLLVTAHMLGSTGYFAGTLTSFPATPISESDLMSHYSDYSDVRIRTTSHNEKYEPRKGYKGMAVICGKKPA